MESVQPQRTRALNNTQLFQDWSANPKDPKAKFLMLLFRLANSFSHATGLKKLVGTPAIILYKFISEWILCIEIHWRAKIGPSASVFHGYGLVIHSDAEIGKNAKFRNGVTIGMRRTHDATGVPVIGDNVDIGANACILGPITIGNNVSIGAGAVVLSDIPSDCTAVGNPARIIRK